MTSDDSTMNDGTEGEAGALLRGLELVWLVPESQVVPLSSAGPLSCGRDASCAIRIAGPSTSREHASIQKDGPIWTIRDLGSKNGVWVNGQRVQSACLEAEAIVRVGDGVAVVVPSPVEGQRGLARLAPGLLGGPRLALVARQARLAAQSDLNVVLEAESGSGKECFARAIHSWSGRTGDLVPINCAALPANLAEAELFGYLRGAFTGAERNHPGYFRAAADGTLFLDEVLELTPSLQAKLLRAVEHRAVVPLGSAQSVPAATRIVAACQTSMADAADSGRMRPDLFARLNGITIRIPSLRQRREDILPLFQHFLSEAGADEPPRLSPAAVEALCLHDWPLNVRELESVARRLVVLHPGETSISLSQLAGLIGQLSLRSQPVEESGRGDPIWNGLLRALTTENGNVLRAAELVGISRQRAYRILARHPEFDVSSLRRS